MGNNNNKQIWETLRTSSSGWPLDECNRNGNRNRNSKKTTKMKKIYNKSVQRDCDYSDKLLSVISLYRTTEHSSSAAHRLKLGDIGGLTQTDTWLINELCNYRQKQQSSEKLQTTIAWCMPKNDMRVSVFGKQFLQQVLGIISLPRQRKRRRFTCTGGREKQLQTVWNLLHFKLANYNILLQRK